jgi:hypothetical protein
MGNIFSNKSFMSRYFSAPKSTGPAQIDPMYNVEPGVQQQNPVEMQEQDGPAKTRSEKRLERTKLKVTQAKESADEANDGSTDASLGKMNRTKAKAQRLEKREKRQEGRADRKKIRSGESKPTKDVTVTKKDPLSGVSRESTTKEEMTKREAIKASRKNQKESGPAKLKKKSSY